MKKVFQRILGLKSPMQFDRFGNGDWQFKVYEALIKHGVIAGELDSDGYVDTVDIQEADKVVTELIKWVFNPKQEVTL